MRHNRINERALNRIIRESIDEAVFTDEFKDKMKRFGKKAAKGIGKGALYSALALGSLYACDRGAEKEYQRQQRINRDAAMMNNGDEKDIQKYLRDHNLEDNEYNRRQADEHFENMRNAYFKNRDLENESYYRRNKRMVNEGINNPRSLLKYIEANILDPEDKNKLYTTCKRLVSWVDKTYHVNDSHSVIQDYM